MKKIIILILLFKSLTVFPDNDALLFFLNNPYYIQDDNKVVVKGRVLKINGFPDSYNIDIINYYGIPCYEVIVICDEMIEEKVFVNFGKFDYLSYYIRQESTLSLEEWFDIEKSFVPQIGEVYDFLCIEITKTDPLINLYPLYSLHQKENVSGFLVVKKTKIS
jgi:hypothetical protein